LRESEFANAGGEDRDQLVGFSEQLSSRVGLARQFTGDDEPQPQSRFARFFQDDGVLRCKLAARVRTLCFLVVCGNRRSGIRKLPGNLAHDARFRREFSGELDDVTREPKRPFGEV
jgi:hypothetical protein